MKLKIDLEKIKNATVKVGSTVLKMAVLVAPFLSMNKTVTEVRYIGPVTYSDAISALLSSNMFSGDKTKIAAMLPKNKNADFYRSIIAVIESTMFSNDKVKMIKDICEDLSEEES